MNSSRRVSKALGLLLAALTGAGCRDTAPRATGTGGDSIYVGVEQTVAGENGVRLAVRDLNAQRPAGARPFAVRLAPPAEASQVNIATGFRDDPAVIAVIGHQGSAQLMDAAPIYADLERNGARALPVISPTATNPLVTKQNEWIFRVCPTDIDNAQFLARFARDSLHAKRVAIIYRNDLFGRGFTRAFSASFRTMGGEIAEQDPYVAGVTAFDAYSERIVRAGVDALLLAGGAATAPEMLRSLHKAGGAGIAILASDDMTSRANDTAMVREFGTIRYASFYQPSRASSPAAVRFAADFRNTFGQAPNHQSALAYDATMLIGKGISVVGVDRHRLRDWLANVGRGGAAFSGITGDIRFNENRDVLGKPILVATLGE